MQITGVTTRLVGNESWGEFVEFPLVTVMSKYPEYNNAEGDTPEARRKWAGPVSDVLVEVETDAGITGHGHATWLSSAIATVVEETLSKLVIGADPRQREALWDRMYRATIPFGRKGAAVEAISAVDIALWDVAGKAAGKPVYELLGGPVTEEIPCYASNLHPVDHEKLAREAVDYVERGFDAMKLRFKHGPEAGRAGMAENEAVVQTVREAVGDEIAVAGDAYMGWNARYAKEMCRRLEPYDMAWIEEPVIPDDVEGYAEIRAATDVPIAGGEHEFTRWGHKRLLEADAVDILQPDVHRAGGITEAKRIADLASAHGVEVIPHTGTNPTLHLVAATPNAPMAEHITAPVWFDAGDTYADAIYANPPVPEDGTLSLPPGPGVGAAFNEDALAEYEL